MFGGRSLHIIAVALPNRVDLLEMIDVCRCFSSELPNRCAVERGRIAPSLRRCEAEASERLWDQATLFPRAHRNRKILVLRDCQIDSDVTSSHVVVR